MTRTQLAFIEEIDTLHLSIADESEVESVEISPDITAALNAKGELIGLEIINASSRSSRHAFLSVPVCRMLL